MDNIRAFTGRVEQLIRPGHAGDMSSQPGRAGSGAVMIRGEYVTYSGQTPTVHTRLLFGVAGHGFGSEFA